jgi:hypothetical protein
VHFGQLCAGWAWRAAALGGGGYFLFLACWGFNHARPEYARLAGLDDSRPTGAELVRLGEKLARRASLLRARAAQDERGVFQLAGSRDELLERVADAFERAAAVEPRLAGARLLVRPALSSRLMSVSSLSGFYFPFSAEAHVNTQVPAAALGFVACHEAAHACGFAREDEASFLGWLVCEQSGDDELAYSGALAAFSSVQTALRSLDSEAAARTRALAGEAVARDLQDMDDFWNRNRSPLGSVTRASNDLYLRSSGSREGVRSYSRVLELLVAWERGGR